MFKSGLFVGKFVAFHRGHAHYIREFSSKCETLKLVLCTFKTDRVDKHLREIWLRKDLQEYIEEGKIELYVMPQEGIPEYPAGLRPWCKKVNQLVGNFNVIFGNDPYVGESAEVLGIEHYSPDEDRSKFNCSSTKILDSGLSAWDYLNDVNRGYFSKIVQLEHFPKVKGSVNKDWFVENIADRDDFTFGLNKSDHISTPFLFVQGEGKLDRIDDKFKLSGEFPDFKAVEASLRNKYYNNV